MPAKLPIDVVGVNLLTLTSPCRIGCSDVAQYDITASEVASEVCSALTSCCSGIASEM